MTPARLRDDYRVWLQIGLLSFGGPAGQIALMQRRLVDELGWIDARRFLSGLQFCMLLPGPEAQQLASYIGWTRQGWRGALLAGSLFVLPGAIAMLVLSFAYVHWGSLAAAAALLLGLKCAVIALIAQALWRLARRSLHGLDTRLVAVLAFVAVHLLQWPFPAVVLCALALAVLLSWRNPHSTVAIVVDPTAARAGLRLGFACLLAWALPIVLLLTLRGSGDVLAGIGMVYGELAMLSFGGAYALLTHVADRAVHAQHWLSGAQMADGLALAETTPGPLILVLQFVAFVAAWQSAPDGNTALALVASLLTLWVLFLPSFAWILIGAPWIARIEADARFARALGLVSAAAFALILHLGLWMALHVLFAETRTLQLGPLDYLAPRPESLRLDAAALTLVALLMLGLARGRLAPLLLVCAGAGLALAGLR
jgi:chromate transporter